MNRRNFFQRAGAAIAALFVSERVIASPASDADRLAECLIGNMRESYVEEAARFIAASVSENINRIRLGYRPATEEQTRMYYDVVKNYTEAINIID